MIDTPASIRAKAKADDTSFIDLDLAITAAVRDAIHARALAEGSDAVCITWAIEEVAKSHSWIPEGEERDYIAFHAMTYGIGVRLWALKFTEEDGTEVASSEIRELMKVEGTNPRMAEIVVAWPLLPAGERKGR